MTVSVVARIDEFSPTQLAKIAKSLVSLGLWRADLGVGLKRQTQNCVWPLGALVSLCDSLYRKTIELEEQLYPQLDPVLAGLHYDNAEEQQTAIEDAGVENCGILGTTYLMRKLKIEEPDVDFLDSVPEEVFSQECVYASWSVEWEGPLLESTSIRKFGDPLLPLMSPFIGKCNHV